MAKVKPYYQEEWASLYLANCLDILPQFGPGDADVILTDPPWPDYKVKGLVGSENALELFTQAAIHFPRICDRLIVILRCDTDPRFLLSVPRDLKFQRLCWLRRTPPGYRGTLLINADIAYVFGPGWLADNGKRILPGEYLEGVSKGSRLPNTDHPCYRSEKHVAWLIGNYSRSGQTILDPFSGTGTTLITAKSQGRKSIGIEIKKEYADFTVKRMRQSVMNFSSAALGDLKRGG